jgi:hypothetical protein
MHLAPIGTPVPEGLKASAVACAETFAVLTPNYAGNQVLIPDEYGLLRGKRLAPRSNTCAGHAISVHKGLGARQRGRVSGTLRLAPSHVKRGKVNTQARHPQNENHPYSHNHYADAARLAPLPCGEPVRDHFCHSFPR